MTAKGSQRIGKVRACEGWTNLIERITIGGSFLAFICICAKLEGLTRTQYFDIPYAACGLLLIAAACGMFLAIHRLTELSGKLSVKEQREVGILPSLMNLLANYGPSWPARLQSSFGRGLLILAWWLGFAAISICTPHEWSVSFGMVYVGSGILNLQAMARCAATMPNRSADKGECFRIPLIGVVTTQDIVDFLSIASGGYIFLVVQALSQLPQHAIRGLV